MQPIQFDQLPWESPKPGFRLKVFREGATQLRLVEISQGFVESEWCDKGHVGYVLSGDIDIEFSSGVVRFSEGAAILIPPGAEHKHKAQPVTSVVKIFLVEEVLV